MRFGTDGVRGRANTELTPAFALDLGRAAARVLGASVAVVGGDSRRSTPMLEIVADTAGCHDFLLTPCSEATFRHFYKDKPVHRGCFGNLAEALAPHGVSPDAIPVAFNVFMNVPVAADGSVRVLAPITRAGSPTWRWLA